MNRLGVATAGLGLFSVPLVTAGTLWLVCVWCFLQGFFGGAIDSIANAAISNVHGTGAAPWLQVDLRETKAVSDTERVRSVSHVDPATLDQDTTNEFLSVLQMTIDDFVDVTRRSVSGEGKNIAGGVEPQLGGYTADQPLASHGSPCAALLGQRVADGPAGQDRLDRRAGLVWARRGGGIAAGSAGELDVAVLWVTPELPAFPPDKRMGSQSSKAREVGYSGAWGDAGVVGATYGQMGVLISSLGVGMAIPVLWAVPEPPALLRIGRRARRGTLGGGSAIAAICAVLEPLAPSMNSKAGSSGGIEVEALRVGLEFGAKMFINSMMEQYAITNSGGNRVKPAKLVKTDLVKVTLDLCSVSDICGHSLSYPKAEEEITPESSTTGLLPVKSSSTDEQGNRRASPPDESAEHTLGDNSQAQQLGERIGAECMWFDRSPPAGINKAEDQKKTQSGKTAMLPQKGGTGKGIPPISLIVLLAFFLFLYVGAEVGFGAWIAIAVLRDGLSGGAGAVRMASLFWGGITVGRFLAVPLAIRFSTAFLVRANLLGGLLSSVLLLLAGRFGMGRARGGPVRPVHGVDLSARPFTSPQCSSLRSVRSNVRGSIKTSMF
eukprot:jgi/Undpi1/9725/HiC_scaffold_27.g12181.m1